MMTIEPEISCVFESTITDQFESVKVVWVTGEYERSDRKIMIKHQGGVDRLSMDEWDSWCERVGARMSEADDKSISEHGPRWSVYDE